VPDEARPIPVGGPIHLDDPDGYRIELVQWPAGHAAGIMIADMDSA
jgi:hypothetical protein